MASLCGLIAILLLALAALSNAAPMNYTDVSLGQYFWPGEPLVVTIVAQQFDVLITNTLSGNLAVYLNDEPLSIIPAGATVYFEPSITQGWIPLNASFALLDMNSNTTVAHTSLMFTVPPGWIANLTVTSDATLIQCTSGKLPPPINCVFSDFTGSSTFSPLQPANNQNAPGPLSFLCSVQYYPDIIPVGTLFVFGVVAFPQNTPVPGPPTTFRSGAVWTGAKSIPRNCGDAELSIPLTGFWDVTEEYALQWQLEHATQLVTGPYAKPTDESSLSLKTGSKVTTAAVIRFVIPRSAPNYPVPYPQGVSPIDVAGPQTCKSPNRGVMVAMICLSVFLILVVGFGAFFWYYRRFLSHDLREHTRLLGNTN